MYLLKINFSRFLVLTIACASMWVSCKEVEKPILVPDIDGKIQMSDTIGFVNTELFLKGNNFSVNATENYVAFNGVIAEVQEASETQIKVRVPENAQTGMVIYSRKGSDTYQEVGIFTVLQQGTPLIKDIINLQGESSRKFLPGDLMIIQGENFSSQVKINTIIINGVIINANNFISLSENEIQITTPGNASSGNLQVVVYGKASNSIALKLTPLNPREDGTLYWISGMRTENQSRSPTYQIIMEGKNSLNANPSGNFFLRPSFQDKVGTIQVPVLNGAFDPVNQKYFSLLYIGGSGGSIQIQMMDWKTGEIQGIRDFPGFSPTGSRRLLVKHNAGNSIVYFDDKVGNNTNVRAIYSMEVNASGSVVSEPQPLIPSANVRYNSLLGMSKSRLFFVRNLDNAFPATLKLFSVKFDGSDLYEHNIFTLLRITSPSTKQVRKVFFFSPDEENVYYHTSEDPKGIVNITRLSINPSNISASTEEIIYGPMVEAFNPDFSLSGTSFTSVNAWHWYADDGNKYNAWQQGVVGKNWIYFLSPTGKEVKVLSKSGSSLRPITLYDNLIFQEGDLSNQSTVGNYYNSHFFFIK